jgi:hypothetical protein
MPTTTSPQCAPRKDWLAELARLEQASLVREWIWGGKMTAAAAEIEANFLFCLIQSGLGGGCQGRVLAHGCQGHISRQPPHYEIPTESLRP